MTPAIAQRRAATAAGRAETARNLVAHERLFRISIAGELLYSTGLIVLVTALYVTLSPVSRGLALFATFCRLAYAMVWIFMTLELFHTLRLVSGAESVRAIPAEQVHA